ncbi:MAG: helix-turn-helix transcriptional regulator [candidate division Zixibacteria bacterium]|jgi:transcriptional regulator with XRE-family HTH domain|nr:helix-turn-helix transcriptional regulator [candidate division Zixibacteria bacterium]
MMSRTDWITTQNQIRRFRKQRNLRLRDVARLVGIRDEQHVWEWEAGKRVPNLDTALRLSAGLRCPVEILFGDHFRAIREEVIRRQKRYDIRIEY